MAGKYGLRNFYLHKVLTDTVSAFTTDTPYQISGKLVKATAVPTNSTTPLEGDNKVQESVSETSAYALTFEFTDLSPVDVSFLTGAVQANNMHVFDNASNAPYLGVSWEETYSQSLVKFIKFCKVKFETPEFSAETKKKGGISFVNATLKGEALLRNYTGDTAGVEIFGSCIRSDDANYAASTGTNWHTTGGLVLLDATAPTVTVSPADSDANVAVTANITWTFSQPISPSFVNSSNFFLFKESDGSIVAGALSINAEKTVVTLNPTASLTASSAKYKAICTTNVKSLAGTALAANSVVSFTTA